MESSFTPAQKIVGAALIGLIGFGLFKLFTMDSRPPKKLNGVRKKKRRAK